MWTEHHSNHAGDHKQNPEGDRQQLHIKQLPPALLDGLVLAYQARHPARVHLLNPQAHGGHDDKVGTPVVSLQGQHHTLGDRRHGPGQAEGYVGQPSQDAGVAG